jgi:diaminopimelate decarboxylase
MPLAQPDDWVVVHDTGGYTLSMYSRYNSLGMPAVFGHRLVEGKNEESGVPNRQFEFILYKAAETTEQVLNYWCT